MTPAGGHRDPLSVGVDATWFSARKRLAWLLRVNRTYAQHEEFRQLRKFAKYFPDQTSVAAISASQVSRWETGHTPPTAVILGRYEALLELQPGLLTSIADAVLRYFGSRLGAPALRRTGLAAPEDLHDRLDDLIDPVVSHGPISGSSWDELSYHLITQPAVYLPSRLWSMMVERLLAEMIIAERISWFQRFEALGRLLGHPRGQHAVIAACTALVNDPANQVFMDPLSVLDSTRQRAATVQVARQLTRPTNDQALRGALLASVRKVRNHHFSDEDLAALYDPLVQHISDGDTHLDARPLASEVLRLIPRSARPKPGRVLDRMLREDDVLGQVLRSGRIARAHVTAATVTRICAAVLGSLHEDPKPEVEHGLRILTEEMLYSPVSDVRLLSAQMIAATPLSVLMANTLTAELAQPSTAMTPEYAGAILGALPFLATAAHRPRVERLALHGPLPSATADAAVWALAHIPGGHDSPFWTTALAVHLVAWERTRTALAERTIRGLVYGFGVHQHHAALRRVRDDPRVPAAARTAARWWLNLGRDLRSHARL